MREKLLTISLGIVCLIVVLFMFIGIASHFFTKDYTYKYYDLNDKYKLTNCQLEERLRVSYIFGIKTVDKTLLEAFASAIPKDANVICDERELTYTEYSQAYEIWEAERILRLLED